MPSVDVDTPMQDSFPPSTSHVNPSQPCWLATQTSMAPDSSPPYSISSAYSRRSKLSQGSLSFLPSTVYRSGEQSEYSGSQFRRPSDRGPVYVSPFRSVRRMKEPFQLVLPTSPSFESNFSNGKETKAVGSLSGFPTLRACRSDQNLVAGALETFGLLPSPSLSESRLQDISSPTDYSVSKTEVYNKQHSLTADQSCSCGSKSCELCIVSGYDSTMAEQVKNQQEADVEMESSGVAEHHESGDIKLESSKETCDDTTTGVIDPLASPPTESAETDTSPGTSSNTKKRTRSGTFSSDASWVPANLSYCETWLQGVPIATPERQDTKAKEANRRKCQIVQQSRKPFDLRIDTQIANQPVRFATVASKTKPKLVDISRRSSSATSYSVPIQIPLSCTTSRRPSTPEPRPHEISAFSPDTPLEIPDSGYITQQSNRSSEDSHETKEDDVLSDIAEDDVHHCLVSNGTGPSTSFTGKAPPAKGGVASYSYNHSARSAGDKRNSKLHTPSPISAYRDMFDQEILEKWWDYEWTLDQLELSVKNFPVSPLSLTSPVIILLRQNNEKALLKPFKKIFPGSKEPLLGSLCATLIARNYLVSMATSHRRNSSLSQGTNNLSRLDSVPEKARATLGLHLPGTTHGQITGRLMGSRSIELRKGLDRIVDHLIFKICGRSDETLKMAVTVLTQVLETKA